MSQTNNKRRQDEARARVAAARLAQQKAARARRMRTYLGATVAVLVVVAAVVVAGVIHANVKQKPDASATPRPAAAALVAKVTGVSSATLDKVGTGGGNAIAFQHIDNTSTLTINGKAGVVFVGAEYCPYCAATRWAIVQALSRFGTFKGLDTTHSSTDDVQPDTPTFTFVHATYTSPYITFSPVELIGTTDTQRLQTPTKLQLSLYEKYDSAGSFPFLDVANKYLDVGDPMNSAGMANQSLDGIADGLSDASSTNTEAILGTANQLTAAICASDGGQPAAVCTAPSVVSGQSLLTSGAAYSG